MSNNMPRQSREKSDTGIYHVMLRGINRQDIFEDEEDYRKMILFLRGLVERTDDNGLRIQPSCLIYSYCLMSNHLHLLVKEKDEGVSEAVKRIGILYAQYFNRKYERNGHLFQDRFRSEPVNSMEYFVTLIRYIHQNPVKAGLVDHVSEYPWSSWSEYVSHTDGFCATSAVLSRIPRGELAELVCSPVEEYGILDIDADTDKHVSDSETRAFLLEKQGIANPLMVQSLEKGRRDEVLRSAKLFGAGIRQLSRLTGVSFGVIQKI